MKARMHAFVALMLVSIGAGLCSGMPLDKIAETMQKGMGDTLGFLALVVALGAMFGKILHETGAVDQIAIRMLKTFGESRAHYAMGIAGLICALQLFFEVVVLISIAFAVARRTHDNLVKLVIPLFAGVAASAAFLLPGPAPMLLAADARRFRLDDSAEPVRRHSRHADRRAAVWLADCAPPEDHQPDVDAAKLPSFSFSLALILFPLLLVGLKTIGARFTEQGSSLYEWLEFIGHPFTAILLAYIGGDLRLAYRQGMDKEKVMQVCGSALQPAGIILLVIGVGGMFKQVLVDSGVGPVLDHVLTGAGLPIALACFILSGAVRVIQGSATVACLTTVGLVMPVIEPLHYRGAQLAALSICIGGGSIIISHVNDAGFWLFGRFAGATEGETLKTWTLMETILGTVGAVVSMIAFQLLS
ncbi:GntT/GntP/DsdX family permease [Candidatus Pantoea persica]|uniref:GntT/GntP/DsdX family permease n=1 Tax=Candidatus Pantoea persica TaxID=2518128 RepID=UPI00215DA670|nr:SLC13 family permease [Candidatus Pantoea persica]MBA2817461.1 Gluconate transporter [Candidatus Pantoea persica]